MLKTLRRRDHITGDRLLLTNFSYNSRFEHICLVLQYHIIIMLSLKQHLHNLCTQYISEREAEIKTAIADAQEAAANETKSSAGDKYETAREMMTQHINMNQARLAELYKLKAELTQIPVTNTGEKVQAGSIVHTNGGNYYVAVSIGKLHAAGRMYYAISTSSPIARKLLNLQAGDSFEQNGKTSTIEHVV